MQVSQHTLPASVRGLQRKSRDPRSLAPTTTGDEPPKSILERWTERFCERLVAWGEGATHHRMGSWERLR